MKSTLLICILTLFLKPGSIAFAQEPSKAHWDKRFAPCGLNDVVRCVAEKGAKYYLGGNFTTAQGIPIKQPAVWDGSSWSSLGGGLDWYLSDLTIYNEKLFIAGSFARDSEAVSAVAVWDFTLLQWDTVVIVGTNVDLVDIEVDDKHIYIAGYASIYNSDFTGLVRWSFQDQKLYPLGKFTTKESYQAVVDVEISENYLFVSGIFDAIDDTLPIKYLGAWNRHTMQWLQLDSLDDGLLIQTGEYESITDLLVPGGDSLYIVGSVTMYDSLRSNSIALWDGKAWQGLGEGLTKGTSHNPLFLEWDGKLLYAIGYMSIDKDTPLGSIAIWDSQRWSWLENSSSIALHYSGGFSSARLFIDTKKNKWVYGYFEWMGPYWQAEQPLSRWNGQHWIAIDSGYCQGLNGPSHALFTEDDGFYVAGNFTRAGGIPTGGLAYWDGSAWHSVAKQSPLAFGYDDEIVTDLIRFDDTLYMSGNFGLYDDSLTSPLLYLDAEHNWQQALKSVTYYGHPIMQINVLTEFSGDLYVGGAYRHDSGSSHLRPLFAKLKGNELVPVSTDTFFSKHGNWLGEGGITCIATNGDRMFVGGTFDSIGSTRFNNLAEWRSNRWAQLGDPDRPGVTSQNEQYGKTPLVRELLAHDSLLLVAGDFDSLSGMPRQRLRLAQLDINTNQWLPYVLSSSTPDVQISGLCVYNNQILLNTWSDVSSDLVYLNRDGFVKPFAGNFTDGVYPTINEFGVAADNTLVCLGRMSSVADIPSKNIALYKAPPLSAPDHHGSQKKNMSVYPNPARTQVTVSYSGYSGYQVKLVDCLGRLEFVYSVASGSKTFQLGDVAPGMYTCILFDGRETYIEKVLIAE